jgi:hypothetical protein
MSSAISTHHRFSDPLAAAAAVVVILGGASVIGVAMASDGSTAPTAPAQSQSIGDVAAQLRGTASQPFRTGLGDFTQTRPAVHTQPLKGGHVNIGLP